MFVRVKLYDLNERPHEIELPATEPVGRILPALVRRLNLPASVKGQPLQYDLYLRKSGELIKPVCSLHMAGVGNGAALSLRAVVDPHFDTVVDQLRSAEAMRATRHRNWADNWPQLAIGFLALLALAWTGIYLMAVPPPVEIEINRVPYVVTRVVPVAVEPIPVEPVVIHEPRMVGPQFEQLVAAPAGLCFIVNQSADGRQLMCHNAETGRLDYLINGRLPDLNVQLVSAANQFYVVAHQNNDLNHIWGSNGTMTGSEQILSIPGLATTPPLLVGESYLFAQPELQSGWQSLHIYARGSSRAQRLANVFVAHDWYAHSLLHNGVLYFAGRTADSGWELWRSDGTIAGTYLLRDINAGALPAAPLELVPAGDIAYFTADGGAGRQIWQTDGTPAGTQPLAAAISPEIREPNQLNVVGEGLFFTALDREGGRHLWSVQSGLRQYHHAVSGWEVEMAVAGASLYVAELFSQGVAVVWRFTGSSGEAYHLGEFAADGYQPTSLTTAGAEAYLVLGLERSLWRIDDEGLALEQVGSAPAGIKALYASGPALYLTTSQRSGGEALYFFGHGDLQQLRIN